MDQEYGLSLGDFEIFGDRSLNGYQKVKLLTKLQNSVYWIFKRKVTSVYEDEESEASDVMYYIIQQIPRNLANFDQIIGRVRNSEGGRFQTLLEQQGMRKLLFQIEEIVDEHNSLDIWVVFQGTDDLD